MNKKGENKNSSINEAVWQETPKIKEPIYKIDEKTPILVGIRSVRMAAHFS